MANLIEEIENGHIARTVLDTVGDRLDLMANNVHIAWEESKFDDVEGREAAWRQLKAIRELKRSFLNDLDSAKLAQKQLEKENG